MEMAEIPVFYKVFETTELLEIILLNLPLQDLLISAQRVSKKWHATIRDSTALRQSLFYQHIQAPRYDSADRTRRNPFLDEILRLRGHQSAPAQYEVGTTRRIVIHLPLNSGINRFPQGRESQLRYSWEDMYPMERPCCVTFWPIETADLEGDAVTLRDIVEVLDEFIPGPAVGPVKILKKLQ